ncbi:MAG: ABC transporter substrate-binding protein [Betaproteobacteria bacterium]|nr:ABC transporter substrate-binding protein [Betaproteobacteria bacterium]
MNRRGTLIALLALVAPPFAVRAQQPGKVWRLGLLSSASGPDESIAVFLAQLRALGYVEGRTLSIEYRWAAGNEERLPELAAELVQLNVDVIVTRATLPARAAKRATATIPIVMAVSADPAGVGLIASLARPGGNITGMSVIETDLLGKRVQLLHELLPKATRLAALTYPATEGNVTPLFLEQVRAAARQSGMTFTAWNVRTADALAGAFAAMQRERAQALIVQLSAFSTEHRQRIVALAARHRLPAIFSLRSFVDAGGLMCYGPSFPDMHRRAAFFVDRIFKGARPADLPVEQPTTFEMVINLKTAKALGLTIPQAVLLRADEVIQ